MTFYEFKMSGNIIFMMWQIKYEKLSPKESINIKEFRAK